MIENSIRARAVDRRRRARDSTSRCTGGKAISMSWLPITITSVRPGSFTNVGQGLPNRRERAVLHDALDRGLRFSDGDVAIDVLGERVEHVAVEDERQPALRTLLAEAADEIGQPLRFAEDLESGRALPCGGPR